MKKFLLTVLASITLAFSAHAGSAMLDFTDFKFEGATDSAPWSNSYVSHYIKFSTYNVNIQFSSANKQTSGISDCPVTKGNDVYLDHTDGYITSASFVLKSWSNKAQTARLSYSTDGTTFTESTSLSIPSTANSAEYTIAVASLPSGTQKVKLSFGSTNQIGVKSCVAYFIDSASPIADPNFTPAPGKISAPIQVTLASVTDGTTIYYTLDGTTKPSNTSTPYTGPITIDKTTTIKAVAYKEGTPSTISTAIYTLIVADPAFSVASGTYKTSQDVALSCATNGASIYYTLDGTDPSAESTLYNTPIHVSANTTIKAIAIKDGLSSGISRADYTLPISCANTAQALSQNDKTYVQLNFPMTVIYQKSSNLYVTDGTKNLLIYGNLSSLTFTAGQVIPAGMYATKTSYNGLPEFTPEVASIGTATAGTEVTPSALNITSTTLTTADANSYVYLPLVKLIGMTGSSAKNFNVQSGSTSVPGYNKFGIDMTAAYNYQATNPAQTYNLTAIVDVSNNAVQIAPIKYDIPTGIENLDAEAARVVAINGGISISGACHSTIYNAAGTMICHDVNHVACAPGLYIVWTDNHATKVIVK